MAGAISLEGVARVWEQEADLRTRFRDKRRLFLRFEERQLRSQMHRAYSS